MASGVHSIEASYHCPCGSLFPLSSLYYCQRCSLVKCRFCVHETIQCYFCPSCEQNIPSGEAMETENRCKRCFDCPECQTTLKMSAKMISASGKAGNESTREKQQSTAVFFQCTFCHWSSVATLRGGNPEELLKAYAEKEQNETADSFTELVERLKKEEHDSILQERKRRKRSLFRSMSSRDNVSRTFVPGDGFQNLATARKEKEEALSFNGRRKKLEEIAPPFPELSAPSFNVNSVVELPTLQQKLANFPFSDVDNKKDLFPSRKLLSTKVTKTCAECEKVLLKPGINPSQVQFDLRHVAWLFLPRFCLVPHTEKIPKQFLKGEEHRILFSVRHLVQEFMYFKIENLNDSTIGNVNITLPESDTDTYQYILPYQFDPDVDVELQEKLEDLKSNHKDPEWIRERSENSLLMSLPFVPTGAAGSQLQIAFKVCVKFTLPTGPQETSFISSFTLGTIV